MPAELERLSARLAPGLGFFARGVDLHVHEERGSCGWGERSAAEVELGCFLDGVDRTYYPEVGDGGGEGFAFICGVNQFGGMAVIHVTEVESNADEVVRRTYLTAGRQ